LSPEPNHLIDDYIQFFFAAGRDRTFSYGSVYPKETATKTWDHTVGLAGIMVFLESIQHGEYRNDNVEITALAPKLPRFYVGKPLRFKRLLSCVKKEKEMQCLAI
jgi:hypothetical protein